MTNLPGIGKNILITGASSGIGLASSCHLASRGFRVFAGVRRPESYADLLALNLPNLNPLRLDVTDSSSIQAAREIIVGETGNQGLYGLINNAGALLSSPVEFLDLVQYRQLLEVNLIGAIAVSQAMLEMLRMTQGRIINISSVSGLDSAPFLAPYASSKFALEAFSDSLRVELAIWRIKVVLIEPGDVATPMLEKLNQELITYNQNLPERAWELYGPVLEWEKEIKPRGMQPQVVAEAIEKALVTTRPKARYRLGPEARIVRFLRAVPTPVRDWILLHRLP